MIRLLLTTRTTPAIEPKRRPLLSSGSWDLLLIPSPRSEEVLVQLVPSDGGSSLTIDSGGFETGRARWRLRKLKEILLRVILK